MTKEFQTLCDPPPNFTRVNGFNFYRVPNGGVSARCVWCITTFDAEEANPAKLRRTMVAHQNVVHGRGVR